MSDFPERLSNQTTSPQDVLSAEFQKLFPGVIQDGVIDSQRLSELLSLPIAASNDTKERFGLMWAGKRDAVKALQAPSMATLKPVGEDEHWDAARHVFIEGDNLEALKLLQKAYNDQVKLIYIDPPYNTGNDFVYNDDFSDPVQRYLEVTGQVDAQGNKLVSNTETSGRKHSNWLSMMYPRLVLSRNLLREDGVIFISIDDNEAGALKFLLDEIYGEKNHLGTICHKSRASVSNDKIISPNHNFIYLYARNQEKIFANRSDFGLEPETDGFNLSDERGEYKFAPVDGPGGALKGNPHYTFQGVTGYFRYSQETMQELWDQGYIVKRGNGLQRKRYKHESTGRKTDTTWWDQGFYTSSATQSLKKFLGDDLFDSPKPVGLVQRMLELHAHSDGDIVLDFFAGSGTTGHAVVEQNNKDGVQRRFVLVNIAEKTPEKSVARDKGFDTVSSVTKFRLRAVSDAFNNSEFALFRAFELNQSCFNSSALATSNDDNALLLRHSLRAGVSQKEISVEMLLKSGVRLDSNWETFSAAGHDITLVEGVASVPILEISEALIDALIESPAHTVLFLEDAFEGKDSIKANAYFSFKQANKTMKTF
jgi:adenine-specific DNA-methyltransferase